MGDKISCTLKLDEDVHLKFKIISAISGETMSDMFSAWIKKQKVVLPDFGSGKKSVSKEKKEIGGYDREEILKTVKKYKADGMTHREIASRLEADGIPTKRGGPWKKDTIANMVRNPAQSVPTASSVDGKE